MVLHKNISLSARHIFLHLILSFLSVPGRPMPPPKTLILQSPYTAGLFLLSSESRLFLRPRVKKCKTLKKKCIQKAAQAKRAGAFPCATTCTISSVAELAAHNRMVAGSNPAWCSTKNISLSARNIFLHSILSLFSAPGRQTPPPKAPILQSPYTAGFFLLSSESRLLFAFQNFFIPCSRRAEGSTCLPSSAASKKCKALKKKYIQKIVIHTIFLSTSFQKGGVSRPP